MKKMASYRIEPVIWDRIVKLSEAMGMSQAEVVELSVSHVYDLFSTLSEGGDSRLLEHETQRLTRLLRERAAIEAES